MSESWEYVNWRPHAVLLILGERGNNLRALRVEARSPKQFTAGGMETIRVYKDPDLGDPLWRERVMMICNHRETQEA